MVAETRIVRPPDLMKVLAELTKVELVRAGQTSSDNIDTTTLNHCSRYLDTVTGTRKKFLSQASAAIRALFRAIMDEAKIKIESDNHLFNVIGRFCRMMKKVMEMKKEEALERLKRFIAALASHAYQFAT